MPVLISAEQTDGTGQNPPDAKCFVEQVSEMDPAVTKASSTVCDSISDQIASTSALTAKVADPLPLKCRWGAVHPA
jgi:hypothetical protein